MMCKTKEEKLWDLFSYRLRDGATYTEATPFNKRLIYNLSCYVWHWRQEYKAHYRIDEATYNGLLQTAKELEDQIQSDKCADDARQAIEDAYSWLRSFYYRVAKKNRVF